MKSKIKNQKSPFILRLFKYLFRLIQSVENLRFEVGISENQIMVYSNQDTLKKILHGYSISRYGDGEFELLKGNSIPFQNGSRKLQSELIRLLQNNQNQKLLIAIPPVFNSLKEFVIGDKIFWRIFMNENRELLKEILIKKDYFSSFITRPYLRYKDKTSSEKIFSLWKKVWNKKDVMIIEGNKTFFGVNNNFLNKAKKIRRIILPSRNAYSYMGKVLTFIETIQEKPDLIIIALGPTATVLAAKLTQKGYQAIDIGHLDIEYEWFLKKTNNRVEIKGKDILELGSNKYKSEEKLKYKKDEIIAIFS